MRRVELGVVVFTVGLLVGGAVAVGVVGVVLAVVTPTELAPTELADTELVGTEVEDGVEEALLGPSVSGDALEAGAEDDSGNAVPPGVRSVLLG